MGDTPSYWLLFKLKKFAGFRGSVPIHGQPQERLVCFWLIVVVGHVNSSLVESLPADRRTSAVISQPSQMALRKTCWAHAVCENLSHEAEGLNCGLVSCLMLKWLVV